VRVENGALVLTARARPVARRDCGRPFIDPTTGGYENRTTDCPIISGAVMSQRFMSWDSNAPPFMKGFLQQYCRIEVRGRLPKGPGSWPAHWMLPQEWGPGWPYSGEIDIMELWIDKARRVKGSLHDGDEASGHGFNEGHAWRSETPYYSHSGYRETWFDDFHTYAVEWDPWEIRFTVDRWTSGTTPEGRLIKHRKSGNSYAIDVPDAPFYVLLNSTIAPFRSSWWWHRPDPDDFQPQTHEVDFVRAWQSCESTDEYCPWGGTWDGAHCLLQSVPTAARVWIDGATARYASPDGCPHGGTRSRDGTCVLASLPDDAAPFLWAGNLYAHAVCRENTLSPTCRNPCAGLGLLENEGCFLGESPSGFKGGVKNGKLYYWTRSIFTVTRAEDCLPGHGFEQGEGCVFGTVPAGRLGSVSNDDGVARFFLNHTCDLHEAVPNCPRPCPAGGRFEGERCFLRTAPQGTSPFLHDNKFYYQRLSSDPAAACPAGGFYDGANCHLGAPPAGRVATLHGNRFGYRPACTNVPF
jgi:hypothetical protein